MAARNTTYDMGNGDLVRDQHEDATLEKVADGEFESHEVVLQPYFHDKKSEFHDDNFEGEFPDDLHRGPAPRSLYTEREERVVVVRDEYGSGRVSVYPIHDIPSFVHSNRYTVLHAPESYPHVDAEVNE